MLLSLAERIFLLEVLEEERGFYPAMKALEAAKLTVAPNPEEMKKIVLNQEEGGPGFRFNMSVAASMVDDFPIDEWTTNFVRNKLSKAESKGELLTRYKSLYEKFVIDYNG